jgi:hypothetical protein
MEPFVSGLSHILCTEVANALADIVVAIFNVDGIQELTYTTGVWKVL